MNKFQVAIVGINSIFGGTSALLLKQSPFIKCLKLYDQKNVEAAVDLSSINTQCKVKMFLGNEQLANAFEDADIIVIGDEANEAMMNVDSHLMTTAGNLRNYAKAIAEAAPHAIIVVASTPVNCLLPIMSQLLVKEGCYDYNKVVGSTLVDTIRASSILACHLNLDPKEVVLPVIGGSSERTRVPVFSQSRPYFSLKKDEKNNLIMNIRRGDAQVLANKGSPEVLNRAYSTVRFLNSIMAGLRGDSAVTDITLCRTDLVPGVQYFSLPVIFGKDGIVKRYGIPKTTDVEEEMVEEAIKHVRKDADKAAYIVRGAMELPEQKYLSSNERASSQKEIFDLYVKCLPKPVDNRRDSMPDYIAKQSASYSFKNLVKEGPSVNHLALPQGKTFRRVACDKLKNLTSEDSFLKSTGFFTSPLRSPILILEPMGCPSAPQSLNDDSEIADIEGGDSETEDHYILHEQNLATASGDSYLSDSRQMNASMTPTCNSPITSNNEVAQLKTIDPIAKLKGKIEDSSHNGSGLRVPKLSKHSARREKQHITETDETDPDEKISDVAEYGAIKPAKCRSREITEQIEEKDVSYDRQRFCHAEEDTRSYSEEHNGATSSFIYNIRSDRALPVYNIYNRKVQVPSATVEEKDELQEIAVDDSKYHKMDKDERYKKLVSRLFRKLDGMDQGMYLPLKSSDNSKSKCKQSFTESAVRSKSHWTSTGQFFQSKPPFRVKLDGSPFDAEQTAENSYYNNSCSKKAGKPAPIIKSFVNQSVRKVASSSSLRKQPVTVVQDDEAVDKKVEALQVICPKCKNKITCSPHKFDRPKPKTLENKIPNPLIKEKENAAEIKKDVEVKRINVSYYGPRPDYCRTYYRDDRGSEITASTSLPVLSDSSKTRGGSELNEERLRKLKEKINQKLIPLLSGKNHTQTDSAVSCDHSGSNSMSKSSNTDSQEPSQREQRHSNETKSAVGTPFVVGKKAVSSQKENSSETKNKGLTPGTKWQGIPFVLKTENQKAERRRKEEQNSEDCEENTMSSKQQEQLCAEGSCKSKISHKRSAKTPNKLQMLGLSFEPNTKPVQEEKVVEVMESEKLIKDNKKKMLKKEIANLKSEDVQNYMQARIKDSFDRSQQQKNADCTCEEISKVTNSLGCDEKKENSGEFSERNIRGQLDVSSETGAETTQSLLNQTVAEVGLKPDSSDNSKDGDASESKRLESKNDDTMASCGSEPVEKSQGDRAVRVCEVSAKLGEDEQSGTSKSSGAESAKLQARRMENSSDIGTIDKNGTKILRSSLVTSSESRSVTNPLIELIVGTPKSANKLQLLVKARELTKNKKSGSMEGKLQNVWEQTLNGKTSTRATGTRFSFKRNEESDGVMGKTSAAVKIAQSSNTSKMPSFKVKLKAPSKNSSILEGLKFPTGKPKRKSTHNLLKELASSAAQKRSRQMAKAIHQKKPVRRGRSLNPVNQIHSYEKVAREANSFADGILSLRKDEYARDEEKLAKLASEVIMKRELTRPKTEASKWKLDASGSKTKMNNQIRKRSSSSSSVRNLRNQWTDYGITKSNDWESRIKKTANDVLSKLMVMPQVRHQMEHFQNPLGPMEVQPGLAPLNYTTIGSKFPAADNSWESVLFNEYVRSNLLPSLKDTRETFHFEERPS